MTEQNRIKRELESRALTERPKRWMPPELLPEPDKQAGYEYRWIRVSMLGKQDGRNVSTKIREGWEPVKLQEQPQFKLLTDPTTRFEDGIEIGGLLLCKTPEEFVEQRKNYYANQNQLQAEAVDNNLMRQSDPRMPIFKERKSSTSFGTGT
jgi:hypothetical protein